MKDQQTNRKREEGFFDLERVIASKNPALLKVLPVFDE